MDKKIFFGLVKKQGVDPMANIYGNEPDYQLYLINDTDSPVTLKRQGFAGYKTFDDTVAMLAPQDNEVETVIEPHAYILYRELYADSFDGAGEYEAVIETEGNIKTLILYTSRGVGFLGTLIPVVGKYGRVLHPHIKEV